MAKTRVEWDDDAKAAVYVQWVSNDKNVRQTSRETGVPHTTVAYWARQWEKDGPPAKIDDKIRANAYEFVHHATLIREKAMKKLEELIPDAEVKQLSTLATVVGIMDDKLRLAQGLATKRTETVHTLPSKEDMRELMSGFSEGLVAAAEDRASEVVVVEATSVVVNSDQPE
jgi:transposase-like protein